MGNTQSNEYENAMEILEKLLKIEFSEYQFTKEEKDFLVRYKIIKKENEKDILIEILGKQIFTTVTDYYATHSHVNKAKILLQNLYNRFSDLCERDSNAFNGFIGFLEWWYSKVDGNGNPRCYYCGIDEPTSKEAFHLHLFTPKKTAWKNGSMQIDKMDPDSGYNKGNCVFACVLCNNAKSDLISFEDFEELFKPTIQEYWERVKCRMKKLK